MIPVRTRRGSHVGHCLGLLAVAGLVLSGAGCVPGSSINVCALCLHSHASTRSGNTPTNSEATPGAAAALPALPLPGSTPPIPTARAPAPGGSVEPGDDDPANPNPGGAGPGAAPPAEQPPGATTGAREPPAQADDPGPAVAAGPGEAQPDLAQRLRVAEGFSATPYPDPGGVPHIGYGHRLTRAEAEALLARDIADARAAAERVVGAPTWNGLTERRREVLAELAYMAGPTGLARFTKMIEAVRAGDYARAADEINISLLRPPTRAVRLANMMREG